VEGTIIFVLRVNKEFTGRNTVSETINYEKPFTLKLFYQRRLHCA
jgi:hypothetical protein